MFPAALVEIVMELAVVLEAKPTTAAMKELLLEFSMECLKFRGQMASDKGPMKISELFPAVIEVPTGTSDIGTSKL